MFIVVGTTTVDLFISGIDRMPRFDGDEYTVSSLAWCSNPLTITCGGNAANSAYVLAALGARAALCSAIGRDLLGDMIAGWLEARGVDLSAVQRSTAHSTSTNTTLLDERLNRLNFYHPGALLSLSMTDVPTSFFSSGSTLLITSYPIMRGFRPHGYREALNQAKAAGATTAIDIGPAIGEPVTLEELAPLLPSVDYLITNDYELGQCTGFTALDEGAGALIAVGARNVVVKRGKDGAALYRADAAPLVVAGFPVQASVTVGAGDSFNAGFLYALGEGIPPMEALRFGCATAAMVVATGKSVLGAPSHAEVDAFLGAHPVV
jgi:sugar/nucleoside kinase (ribokinase family)